MLVSNKLASRSLHTAGGLDHARSSSSTTIEIRAQLEHHERARRQRHAQPVLAHRHDGGRRQPHGRDGVGRGLMVCR